MQKHNKNELLGIAIKPQSKEYILEKIKKYISNPIGFFHVVSLNPENMVGAYENKQFKKVIETAQMQIFDGVGAVLAARFLQMEAERLTGVDLMENLIRLALNMRLTVVLLGGKPNLALKLAECYQEKFPEAKFFGLEGIKDIKNPQKSEEEAILSIVRRHRPHMIFASFGSPDQELWLARHSKELSGIVCMGVGGAFDYLSGNVGRAPEFFRKIGLEWFYRLVREPWRWRRQLALIKFCLLVIKEKINGS